MNDYIDELFKNLEKQEKYTLKKQKTNLNKIINSTS